MDLSRDEEDKIFMDNEKLIHLVIHKYIYDIPGYDYEDLYQLGAIALIKAIRTYKPNKSKFSTYASKCIFNELAYSGRKIQNKQKNILIVSLNDHIIGHDDTIELGDMIEDINNIPSEISISIDNALSEMSERDRSIVKMYLEGYSTIEIRDMFAISQPHVSRIINKFRNKLK